MKNLLFILSLLTYLSLSAQDKDKTRILDILSRQTEAWNKGDLEQFMVGYWNSDSLMYVGKNGITYGYQPTLANYKRNYGSLEKMGTLTFNIIHVDRLSKTVYRVIGQWSLKRSVGDAGGYFTLVFKKINGDWVIVSDHSS